MGSKMEKSTSAVVGTEVVYAPAGYMLLKRLRQRKQKLTAVRRERVNE